jgi:tetratricopeptide (TPR) repeat protein
MSDQKMDELMTTIQDPRTVREYHERGWIYHTQGNYPQAEADFREALAKNNRFAEAYFGLGLVLKLQGERGKSREAFEKAVSLLGYEGVKDDPTRAVMLRKMAQAHLENLEEAS